MTAAERRLATWLVLGALPALLVVASMLSLAFGQSKLGWHAAIDFHTFWVGGRRWAHGTNPYPAVSSIVVWSARVGQQFVYPPAFAAAIAPLALLPYSAAVALFVAASLLAVVLALRILGVRDWRCYGAAFLSPAVLTGVSVGTLSPLLFLAVAVAWRFRSSAAKPAAAVVAGVLAKLFLWPLLIWALFATRRPRTTILVVLVGAASVVAAWAWIGLAGAGSYPALLRRMSTVEGPHSYAFPWLFGGGTLVVPATVIAAGAVVLCTRRSAELGFAVGILVCLLAAPILWLHYLLLLTALLALARPRFSPLWLVPCVLWVTPQQGSGEAAWRTAIVMLVIVTIGAATVRSLRDEAPSFAEGSRREASSPPAAANEPLPRPRWTRVPLPVMSSAPASGPRSSPGDAASETRSKR